MRILYVEDNATNVILVQRVANMGKHEVINYDDGQKALDHFEQDKPDLILLDVQLRGTLTGLDVAHILRTKSCIAPVIAVTAYAMKGDRQRCLDAGCDDYLPKPISVAELVTVFKRFGDAVASGKPIYSTFKLRPPTTSTPAQPMPAVVLTPTPVSAPVEVTPAAANVAPSVTSSAPSQVAADIPQSSTATAPAESTPPVADALPVVIPATPNPVTRGDSTPVESPSDPLAHRTPTPMNAEP